MYFSCGVSMATNTLQSLNYHHHTPPLGRSQPLDRMLLVSFSPKSNNGNTNNNPPTRSISSAVKAYSLPSTTSSSISPQATSSFDLLHRLLSANDFRGADNETRRLLIALAGKAAQKRGYVYFSEVQFISDSDLKTIDGLWRNHSSNKFGYSVQKRLWEKSNRDFTTFFVKVGWMKKLDTEVLQYNYRAFPDEFVWELNDETPEGHLPLTNALRGIQLLKSILSHPAFADAVEKEEVEEGMKLRTSWTSTNPGRRFFVIPVIFALRNALFLDPPSQSQQQFAKVAEDQRSHMNELEFMRCSLIRKRQVQQPGDSSVAEEVLPDNIIQDLKKNVAKRKTDVRDKVQFKRKRAKGPNPLSCKRKKSENQNHVEGNESVETIRSRCRQRKRDLISRKIPPMQLSKPRPAYDESRLQSCHGYDSVVD